MYAVTDHTILGLLRKKAAEGVDITLFYDASASADLQLDLGQRIHAHPVSSAGLMHHKIAIVDERLVFLGSANLTTQSLKMHDNLVLGLYHPDLAAFLNRCSSQFYAFEVAGQPAELWLLPDGEGLALERLLALIDGAKKSIYVAMFTLTHPRLCQALIAARGRQVDVRCAVDFYTAQGASLKTFASLQAAGVKIVASSGQQLLHHKWAWIDGQSLVMGSANWTKSAFAKNQDCFVILSQLSSSQKKFIGKIWQTIELECN